MHTRWDDQTVRQLNERQKDGSVHPYTCGAPDCGKWVDCLNWAGEPHAVFFRSELITTTDGWVCPNCDYTQDWYV
jgi:hypothetical protein